MGNEVSRAVAVKKEKMTNWVVRKRSGVEPPKLHRDRSIRSGLMAPHKEPPTLLETDETLATSAGTLVAGNGDVRRHSSQRSDASDQMISSSYSRRGVLKRNSSNGSDGNRPKMSSSRVTFVDVPSDVAGSTEFKLPESPAEYEQDEEDETFAIEMKEMTERHSQLFSETNETGQQEGGSLETRSLRPLRHRLSFQRSLSTGELRKVKEAQRSGRKIRRRSSSLTHKLSGAQIHMIKTMWKHQIQSQGPTVIGTKVFSRIFFKLPHMKESFRKVVNLPEKYTNHDALVKCHYKALSDMVSLVVNNLENLPEIGPKIEEIGRTHGFITELGFKHDVWNILAESFIDCTFEWGDRRNRGDDFRKGWAVIMSFITEKLKLGHREQHMRELYNE